MHIGYQVYKWDLHLGTLTIWSQTCNKFCVTLDILKEAF